MQTPKRCLNLTGASNFRDLGGYAGSGGRTVRWRRLFRSDHLADLTPDDLATLRELGLARTFDFRGVAERAAVPYVLPGVVSHGLPIEPTVVQRMKELLEARQQLTVPATVRLMQQTYVAFVHDNSPRFTELFRHLLDNDTPLVFHCTAGKDRTGLAAALILLALGVARPVVMQDYLLTNDLFRQPSVTPGLTSPEVLDVLWRVQEGFLNAALHAVDADYGGVPQYLQQTLRLGPKEQQRLAELYLQA
jgi:protein-tyrosine phosphatase